MIINQFIKHEFLILILTVISLNAQPSADKKMNFTHLFFRLLSPQWRNHRATLRPFSGVVGSPVLNLRFARDLSVQDVSSRKTK